MENDGEKITNEFDFWMGFPHDDPQKDLDKKLKKIIVCKT